MTETRQTMRFTAFFFLYYLAASFVPLFFPAFSHLSDEAYLCIMQLICLLPPTCLYFLVTKKPLRQTLRLNPLSLKNCALVILLGFAVQPIMSLLSFVSGLFFPNPVEQSIDGMLASGFWLSLLSTAILPPILEELPNRGILLSGYRYLGKEKAAVLSALLFAFLHMNPQQFLYAFAVGILFAVLVERTDSILASILPHCIINGTTVVSVFLEPTSTGITIPEGVSLYTMLIMVFLLALLALPTILFLLYLFFRNNPPRVEPVLLTEDGTPYRESWVMPEFWVICGLYVLFAIVPYFLQ